MLLLLYSTYLGERNGVIDASDGISVLATGFIDATTTV
jgi:hypothetical protein